jgi:ElaB/YqjD/DUF883 family membrane-anchored ribosome-binding protein
VVDELKQDITARIDEVKDCVNNLEKNVAKKCTISEVKEHVGAAMLEEASKLKQAINSHLKDETQRLFRQEKDREQ